MNSMNKKDVQLILKKLEVKPKKHLGQNFLIDDNLAKKIISESELLKDDIVLEIGPGLGILTNLLLKKVKKIYAIEIDTKLCKYLSEKFSVYENIEIINADILKIELPICNKVVSNIPYSITGPLLEKVFFWQNPPHGIITIPKLIADRVFFKNTYKNISRITISFNSFMKPLSKFNISRNCFFPIPKIDLTLIKMKPKKKINPFLFENDNKKYFLSFVAGIMPYKNKNIANALELFLKRNKKEILNILLKNNFENRKVFNLKIEDYVDLSQLFIEKTEPK